MNEFDLFRQWRADRYGYASQQEFSEVDQFEAWQARADIALKRIRKLEAVLQWLLWLHNDDLHGTTPVASEAEWDEAWETASELVEEWPR